MAFDRIVALLKASPVILGLRVPSTSKTGDEGEERGITPTELMVLMTIAGHENEKRREELDKRRAKGEVTIWDPDYYDSYSRASAQRMAMETGLSYASVRRSLRVLVSMGLLLKLHREQPHPSWYALNPDVLDYLDSFADEAKREWRLATKVSHNSSVKWRFRAIKIPAEMYTNPSVDRESAGEDYSELNCSPIPRDNDYEDDFDLDPACVSSTSPARAPQTASSTKTKPAEVTRLVDRLLKAPGLARLVTQVDMTSVTAGLLKTHPEVDLIRAIRTLDKSVVNKIDEAKNKAGYLRSCLDKAALGPPAVILTKEFNDENVIADFAILKPGEFSDLGFSNDEEPGGRDPIEFCDEYVDRLRYLGKGLFSVSDLLTDETGIPYISVTGI